jgi:hypothetical protein
MLSNLEIGTITYSKARMRSDVFAAVLPESIVYIPVLT